MRRAPSGVPVMRIVDETNTVLLGLLWQGPLRCLLDLARGRALTLCTSATLLAGLVQDYERLAEIVEPERRPVPFLLRDGFGMRRRCSLTLVGTACGR
jgi:hypothetical protein